MDAMSQTYQFTCPECATDITVDEAVKDELFTTGCVLCNSDVTGSDFTRILSND